MGTYSQASPHKLSVYYDGLCPLCTREIDYYKKQSQASRVRFVDITDPQFNAKIEGLAGRDFFKKFHAKKKDGTLLSGVDAFIEIWNVMEIFKPLKKMASNPITRPFFDLGYFCFAKIRPFLRKSQCDSNYCHQ